MANALKGEVDIVAGEKTYTLVFTSNAIAQAEQLAGGVAIGELAANLTQVSQVRLLLWAALQKHHQKVDLLGAGDLLDEVDGGLNGLADPLVRALRFRLSGGTIPLDAPLTTEGGEA